MIIVKKKQYKKPLIKSKKININFFLKKINNGLDEESFLMASFIST